MPIYAYKCSSCGHADDVLQKISADALTDCPACGKSTYARQLTAPGFQLKGSGWYVTDFKGGKSAAAPAVAGGESGDAAPAKPAEGAPATTPAAPAKADSTAPAASTPAATPAATPAPAAGSKA
jgi:putative FmdB family regulatory protein